MFNGVMIGTLLVGVVLCLFGFKVQKFLIMIAWFLLGYNISYDILMRFSLDSQTVMIIAAVIGLLLSSVGYKLEKLALFIAVAYLVYRVLGSYLSFDEVGMEILVKGGVSLLVGGLATTLIRPIIIIISSLYGSTLIKDSFLVTLNLTSNVILLLTVIIIIIGIIFQYKTTKG